MKTTQLEKIIKLGSYLPDAKVKLCINNNGIPSFVEIEKVIKGDGFESGNMIVYPQVPLILDKEPIIINIG